MEKKIAKIKKYLITNTVVSGVIAFVISLLLCLVLGIPTSLSRQLIFTIVMYSMVFIGFFGGIVWAMAKM